MGVRMKILLAAFAVLFSCNAHAQQQAFVPFTVSERDYNQILTLLGEVPAKWANPILSGLNVLEVQAQRQAQADAVKAKETKPESPHP